MIIREEYLKQIRPFYDKNLIKVITGIRRSGKSTLLTQIKNEIIELGAKEDQVISLNFEDYSIRKLKSPDYLYDYIEKRLVSNKKTYIFLDEIQEVYEFEKVINSLNATRNVDIYVTGSNSTLLSGEYATLISGRYISYTIFPFSFKEMKIFYKNLNNDDLLTLYIKFGGMPVIQNLDSENEKISLLNDLYDSIIIKDIVKRHNIKSIDKLDKYITYMLNTIPSLFSGQNIIKYFKSEGRSISKETLYNYIKYLKDVMLLYSSKRYDLKGKKLLTTNEKFFVNDQGIRATKFNNQLDIEKILENIVYFELLRRGYTVNVGEINGKEIDFIASKQNVVEYYQVSYLMGTEETREREFSSLGLVQDQHPKFVISMDKVDFSINGIKHINIIDFLLGL